MAGLPSRKTLEEDPSAHESLSESKNARWHQWTRGRALAAGIALMICFALGLGLWVVGSLRATRFINSSFSRRPGEELRGAIEFIVGTVLMIGGPATVALLRRTTFWKLVAGVAAIAIGGVALASLAGWPPESSWSF